ncbi:MAG: PHP domain-containing protein [Peptostreptococcaceae bacterium]|nr:PHP domain-containing protein [Peptostreptococcaceae bacterium]
MKLYYDFHIHSALSPCGDEDMTPNNIINMAMLKKLDAIALTDHNIAANCSACTALGRRNGIIVIPGMEVQTKEEVHVLCLFETIEKIEAFGKELNTHFEWLPNREEILGRQLILDEDDRLIGEEKRLLIHSVDLSIYALVELAHHYEGLAIPAHIDKKAFSLISNLGFISPDLNVDALELYKMTTLEKFIGKNPMYKNYRYIFNSDAHYLHDISERDHWLEVEDISIKSIFKALRKSSKGDAK